MSYDAPPPQQPPQEPPYGGGQPPSGGQPPYGGGQPPYGGYGGPPRNHPRAVPALVCGILALVLCGIFTGIPAIIMGNRATREIDASGGQIQGRGMAKAGVILGWIAVAWTALVVLLVIVAAAGNS
jgi:Domain of unknown function (DUF4190)